MNLKNSILKVFVLVALIGSLSVFASAVQAVQTTQPVPEGTPLFITAIVRLDNGNFAVSERGTRRVVVYNSDFKKKVQSFDMTQTPTGLASKGNYLYVTQFDTKGEVVVLNIESGTVHKTIVAGSGATAPSLSGDGKRLYVCNQFQGTVSEIDLATAVVVRSVAVLREPTVVLEYANKNILLVANFLPQQRADIDTVAAKVSVIDLKTFKKIKDIQLANGSNALHGMAISNDGAYAAVTHNLGRFQVPTSQLQQGWMNTSAISVINLNTLSFEGAVLVDEAERGAGGTWDVKFSADKIVISHSGTHDISIIDYKTFVDKFRNTADKDGLSYDLRFLYGIRERINILGNGPREFTVHNNKAYIPTFFSDTLNIVDLNNPENITSIALNPNRIESDINKGEKYFNDAAYCFQNWQSCNGCHPGDARTDAMNWDLMNDGIGNPKSCKSMLYAHVTPPNMISGIRAKAQIAVRAGFKYIQFMDVPEEKALCVDEYLMSLRPVPSPLLVNGELSAKAKEGRKVFESLGCDKCHSGPYFTDLQMYRIGKDVEFEKGWDTPTLVEVWRTAPYLFDGRAATMEELFGVHKHGVERKVTKLEIEQLVEYVKSL